MRKQVVAALFLASLMIGGAANAAVTVSGEGAVGYFSDGNNGPLSSGGYSVNGYTYGLFNNSIYLNSALNKDSNFYSELQLKNDVTGATGAAVIVNELNVTLGGFKFGRFTAPFGYYVPNGVYSSWNKLQRADQFGAATPFAQAPGYENGVMYAGKVAALSYNLYSVQGGQRNAPNAPSAVVRPQMGLGAQAVYAFNANAELGLAYYSKGNEAAPTAYNNTLTNLFGKYVFGAFTAWGEYQAGSIGGTTAINYTTILAEVDFALNKVVTLATRYNSYDPDTSVSNDGVRAFQLGAEYAASDFVSMGVEYTNRSAEAGTTVEANSFTGTTQFKF